jgi:hypothetical protein
MMMPDESQAKMELGYMVMLSWYPHVAETKYNILVS